MREQKRTTTNKNEKVVDIVNRKAYNENWETLTKKRRHFQAYFDRVTGRTAKSNQYTKHKPPKAYYRLLGEKLQGGYNMTRDIEKYEEEGHKAITRGRDLTFNEMNALREYFKDNKATLGEENAIFYLIGKCFLFGFTVGHKQARAERGRRV